MALPNLGTAVAVVHNTKSNENTIRALCDSGSQISLISRKTVNRLGLGIKKVSLNLIGAQETRVGEVTGKVILSLRIPNSNHLLHSNFYVVPKISKPLPERELKPIHNLARLRLADPHYEKPGEIEALFGIDIWLRILLPDVIYNSNQSRVIAQQTRLGFVVFQTDRNQSTDLIAAIQCVATNPCTIENRILTLLQRFWEVEDLPKIKYLSQEEKDCERIFTETHTRNRNGRYVVTLPFNEKICSLGQSKNIAIRQFFSIERRMTKNPQYRESYIQFMQEHEERGYMTRIKETAESGYYTPHHGVFSSNKFRVVFNASNPTTTGISLNECQLNGEKLQSDLAFTLLRFRTFRVALCADVKQMYCQIEVNDLHKKYQKIIWRESENKPLNVYVLNRVVYGQTSAPFLAIRAMQQCARDYSLQYPLAAKHVMDSFYVDDLLTGSDNEEQATELRHQLTELLLKGKFELAKWCSNSKKVSLSVETAPIIIEINDPTIKSVLGLCWEPNNDTLMFKATSFREEPNWTKRKILSNVGKLYDPNGCIAPIVVVAKILIQSLWRSNSDWDEPIEAEIEKNWLTFLTSLKDIGKIKIPRWLHIETNCFLEMHGFADASESAYAAVVYVRTINNKGNINSNLVFSKTRVSPLKKLSIPRLELCGAYLLAKLMKSIKENFPNKINRLWYWTDSEVVFQWLQKSPSELKTFVANRIAYIQHETIDKGEQWHWVPGAENPADVASRGCNSSELHNMLLWWHGPSWLLKGQVEWPKFKHAKNDIDPDVNQEIKTVNLNLVESNTQPKITTIKLNRGKWPLLSTYSSLKRLTHVIAYVLRAIHNFKSKITANQLKSVHGPLSTLEKMTAELLAVRLDQQTHMSNELNLYRHNTSETIPPPLTGTDRNKERTMWYDLNTHTLRLFGRIASENLTFDEKFPIIVSTKGQFSTLLLRDIHQKVLHGGVQQMLQILRQKYWIFKARQLARTIVHACNKCFRYQMKTSQQLMAALPTSRTKPTRPFKTCGVDYMGPIGILSRTGRNPQVTKGYVCLFVCFATRAIHLELVSSASTEHFLQALRRFIARRGPVTDIWSDNGTNFVGANGFIKSLTVINNQWAPEILANEFSIKWHFIVPNAPSWGGLWEAGVKSVKRHFVRVVGDQNLTFEECSTLLAQIEACVNSRPICPISDDPHDLNALTPGHFLVGENLITLGDSQNFESHENFHKRWQMIQQMHQHFWKRWHDEYLVTLIQRPKWLHQTRNLQINDLVVIREDNVPPSRWKLGRIIEIFPSKDGLVRAVKIKTQFGEYLRPINKLGLLLPTIEEQK